MILNHANYLLSTTVIELYHTPILAIFLYMTTISVTDNPPTHTDNPPTLHHRNHNSNNNINLP